MKGTTAATSAPGLLSPACGRPREGPPAACRPPVPLTSR